MLRISTFNIQNDFKNYNINKSNTIYNYIDKNNIDIIGLQEVYSKVLKDLKIIIKDKYNYIGKYRFKSKILLNRYNEMNPIITKYNILSNKTYKLPHFPALHKRIITKCIIDYKGKEISIYNTHLDYKFEKVKKKQLDKIYEIIKDDNNPIILFGDFNLKNNKEIFNNFTDKLKELNINRVSLEEKTFKPSKYKREIDHIFISKNFKLKNKKVIKDLDISDHYPVLIDVEI